MSMKLGANLIDSSKNQVKEDMPDFPKKEVRKLGGGGGQDTKNTDQPCGKQGL